MIDGLARSTCTGGAGHPPQMTSLWARPETRVA